MVSAQELAKILITKFDPKRSEKLIVVLVELLQAEGIGRFQAETLADELAPAVLQVLKQQRAEDLPFFLNEGYAIRLRGKGREAPSDTPETIRAKQARRYVTDIVRAICAERPDRDAQFEILCAGCLVLSGAKEAFATCSSDDGGIDVYGRLLIRPPDTRVSPGLLQTTLLEREVLIVGQCKCANPATKIGPQSIREFHGAIKDCLNKYEGNDHPPTHRVPDNYYRRNDLCIPVFMTTASYSDKATAAAEANEIVLVSGHQIAEFVAYCGIGFVREDDVYQFNRDVFHAWLNQQSCATTRLV